jgi:hypothetical protein
MRRTGAQDDAEESQARMTLRTLRLTKALAFERLIMSGQQP